MKVKAKNKRSEKLRPKIEWITKGEKKEWDFRFRDLISSLSIQTGKDSVYKL